MGNTLIAVAVLLVLLAGALFVFWHLIYRQLWRRALQVRFSFQKHAIYAGEETELSEEIENEKKLPVSGVEIGFRVPKGLVHADGSSEIKVAISKDMLGVAGQDKLVRTHRIRGTKRGKYEIGPYFCRSLSKAQMFFFEKEPAATDKIYVYAERTDVTDIVNAVDEVTGEAENQRALYQNPFAFAGVSGYRKGSTAAMDFDAIAANSRVMVGSYNSILNTQFQIFLDVDDEGSAREATLVEESVSIAASLACRFMMEGTKTGLLINAISEQTGHSMIFDPGTGSRKLIDIERALTHDFSKMKTTDFVGLTMHLDMNQVPVFISKNMTQSQANDLAANLGTGRVGLLVIPIRAGQKGSVSSTGGLTVMYREV